MSGIRLYLDEDILARSLVQALRNAQIKRIIKLNKKSISTTDK